MSEEDKLTLQEAVNVQLCTLFENSYKIIRDFMQEQKKVKQQDYQHLQFLVAGCSMFCVQYEQWKLHPEFGIVAPEGYEEKKKVIMTLREACRVNLQAFQEFYYQNVNKLRS